MALACGCHADPPSFADEPMSPPVATAAAKTPRATTPWPEHSQLASWPKVNESPVPSEGHAAGRWVVTVRTSAEVAERYRSLVRGVTLPVGAWVVKEHFDPRTHAPGPVYAMHKVARDEWEFVVATADGMLSQRGTLDACWRCHAEATADSLFGVRAPR